MAIKYIDAETPAPGSSSKIKYLDEEPGYLEKTAKNIIPDIGQTATGLASMVKEGTYDMPKRALETGLQMASGKPYSETPSGQKDVEFVKGAPQMAKDMARPVTHPIDFMQEHPVQQSLNVLGVGAGVRGLMRGKPPTVPKPAAVTEDVAKVVPEVSKTADLPVINAGSKTGEPHALFAYTEKMPNIETGLLDDKYQIFGDPSHPIFKTKGWGSQFTAEELKEAGIPITGKVPPRPDGFSARQKFSDMPGPESKEPPVVPMGETGQKFTGASKVPPDPNASPPTPKVDPLKAVDDFVTEKYGKMKETPRALSNLGKSLEQKSKGMNLKEIGASPGQIRKLRERFGESKVDELADLAEEKGITKGFFNFQTGNAIKNLNKTSGENIGAIREIAKDRGAVHNMDELIGTIRTKLDPIFMKGTGSAQRGTYLKALEDIKNSGADVESLANTISEKNKFIAKNSLTLPLGPTKEVMKIANRLNNEKINSVLNPQEQALLKESLKDFSAAKVFDKMYGFTYGRDMAGRTGPGSVWNTAKDIGGRKVMQKIYSKVGKGLQSETGKFKGIKSLTSDALDAIDEALDEVIDQMGTPPSPGMAHGGIVGQHELNNFLTNKYGKQKESQTK